MEKHAFQNRMIICAIRDMKSGMFAYGNVGAYVNVAVAKRAFSGMVDTVPVIKSHPEDFAMYQIAFVDSSDGYVEALGIPELIANATDFPKGEVLNA